MAKIVEELIVVKVSQIVKDELEAETKITPNFVTNLEVVVSELLGEGCVIEILREE